MCYFRGACYFSRARVTLAEVSYFRGVCVTLEGVCVTLEERVCYFKSVCYFRGVCVTLEECVCYFRRACVTLEERVLL